MKVKCYNCPNREIGCHINCEYYKQFCNERKAISEKRKEEVELRNTIADLGNQRVKSRLNSIYRTHKR